MKHLLATVVALPLLSSVALAGQPVKLDNSQMDKVTAGAISVASINLAALAAGTSVAAAETGFGASIVQVPIPIKTPFGTVFLSQGVVKVGAFSASAN